MRSNMKRLLIISLLFLAACAHHVTVPPQDEIPNPSIGGRVPAPVTR